MREKKLPRFPRLGREFSYNGEVAHWWLKRASDDAHKRAYGNITAFIQASFPRAPRLIVDYACGAGNLLSLLSRQFTQSRLIGLDGSSYLLRAAERRLRRLPDDCSRRISLIETPLPDLNLLRGRADLAIFCFPNMMPSSEEEGTRGCAFELSEKDRRIAERLSLAEDPDNEGRRPCDPYAVQIAIEQNRRISCNLHRLLTRGGICVRAEYAATQRHEWPPVELQRVSFEEGSLDAEVEGLMPRQWFRVLASAYFRSRVMEDVYQQTGDKRDEDGGYLITVLRAL
jgi:SAM-dependent methyltransferase